MKLSAMTNKQLIDHARQFACGMDRLMRRGGSGLLYGWDMPTFAVLYPVERARWRTIQAEGRSRGLA